MCCTDRTDDSWAMLCYGHASGRDFSYVVSSALNELYQL